MISETIIDLDVRFVWHYNPVRHNDDVGLHGWRRGGCDILHRIGRKVLDAV